MTRSADGTTSRPGDNRELIARLREEADQHFFGIGARNLRIMPVDFEAAFPLYLAAAQAGCMLSWQRVAEMRESGYGVDVDHDAAVSAYRAGANAGNYTCWLGLAIQAFRRRDEESTRAYVRLFFSHWSERADPARDAELGTRSALARAVMLTLPVFRASFDVEVCGVRGLRDALLANLRPRTDSAGNVIADFPENQPAINWLKSLPIVY